jgi:hypothetical protein
MLLKIFLPKRLAFLAQNKAKLCKYSITHWFLRKKTLFVCRKLSKIAENCEHNIDTRQGDFLSDKGMELDP